MCAWIPCGVLRSLSRRDREQCSQDALSRERDLPLTGRSQCPICTTFRTVSWGVGHLQMVLTRAQIESRQAMALRLNSNAKSARHPLGTFSIGSRALVPPAIAADDAVQFFFGELKTLFSCQLKDIFRRFAGTGLLHLIRRQVFEIHKPFPFGWIDVADHYMRLHAVSTTTKHLCKMLC